MNVKGYSAEIAPAVLRLGNPLEDAFHVRVDALRPPGQVKEPHDARDFP